MYISRLALGGSFNIIFIPCCIGLKNAKAPETFDLFLADAGGAVDVLAIAGASLHNQPSIVQESLTIKST